MPPRCQICSLQVGEMMDEFSSQAGGTSKTCSEELAVALDVQNGADHTPEVAFRSERLKDGDKNSSMSSEDLAARVVEDSEDESEVESIRRTRRAF